MDRSWWRALTKKKKEKKTKKTHDPLEKEENEVYRKFFF